ncbi:MAG: endonuclease [Frankiales bacterium]|nr:endonuclease [Frankiales bacterium]
MALAEEWCERPAPPSDGVEVDPFTGLPLGRPDPRPPVFSKGRPSRSVLVREPGLRGSPVSVRPDGWRPLRGTAPTGPTARLVEAVCELAGQLPADLPGPRALEEARVLLEQCERLRVVVLARLADVQVRGLHALDDAPSTSTWVARQGTSLDAGEVALAKRLGRCAQVAAALDAGRLTIAQARKVAAAVGTLRRHVDRPDGLVDGHDGETVVANVVLDGVRQVVCEALGGLDDDDPRLLSLMTRAGEVAQRPVSQLDRLSAAFVLVAEHVDQGVLTSSLGRLLDAVLPLALDERSSDAHDARGFTMVRKPGGGWTVVDGDLDDECGELLHTVLAAEMAVDADSPADTAGYEDLRAQGWEGGDPLPADEPGHTDAGPRSKRQQRHDALRNALRRQLDSGLLGLRDKVAPHLSVTVSREALDAEPGALPAVTASGATLPLALVRRWACSSSLTRFVMSLGGRAIATSHTQRTLTGHERRAKRIETGGRCQGAGCSHGPGAVLVPHHGNPWATTGTTSLADTVILCLQTHRQVHSGQVIRLRDGRRLGPNGWLPDPGG